MDRAQGRFMHTRCHRGNRSLRWHAMTTAVAVPSYADRGTTAWLRLGGDLPCRRVAGERRRDTAGSPGQPLGRPWQRTLCPPPLRRVGRGRVRIQRHHHPIATPRRMGGGAPASKTKASSSKPRSPKRSSDSAAQTSLTGGRPDGGRNTSACAPLSSVLRLSPTSAPKLLTICRSRRGGVVGRG